MTFYEQSKFKELNLERKVKVILDLIYKTEEVWDDFEKRFLRLPVLRDYFSWAGFSHSKNQLLSKIDTYSVVFEELNLRTLLDLAVPLERFLDSALKDDRILVREGDIPEASGVKQPLYFVLDHLRSAFNVGSIFRTGECLGVSHIYLVGYTPTPEDSAVAKTAMGAETLVSWSQHNHIEEVFEMLKRKDVTLVALETTERAVPLHKFEFKKETALIVGNERFGIQSGDLNFVDEIVEIPMMGVKNSLNVANSLSIASFEVIKNWIP